ncbi:MAG TPA: hypothetical protein VF166_09600 [Gemmatimonadaceae bacterium]
MHSTMRLLALSVPVAALVALAGCGRHDAGYDGGPGYAAATVPDSALALGPGDILIRTTDGSVDLALVHDTVWMKLSDSVLNKVQHDLDTTRDAHRSDFGASIAKMVKGTVGSALHARIEIPVADLDNVHYEDGALKFDYRDGARPTLFVLGKARPASFDEHSGFHIQRTEHKPVLQSFSPEDAQRFVAAVRAAMERR